MDKSAWSRRRFFKQLAAGGVSIAGAGSLPAVLTSCTDRASFGGDGTTNQGVLGDQVETARRTMVVSHTAIPGSTWNYLCKQEVGADELLYMGISVDLSQRAVVSTRDLVVYGDTVTIAEVLHLPGRRVFIHARRLVVAAGGGVDVSGKDGDKPSETATGVLNPGEAGPDGASGDDGAGGGSVRILANDIDGTLTVRANGGRGGIGQAGGAGATGGVGPEGAQGNCHDGRSNPGGVGQKGGTGGTGGRGGNGGAGGDAGTVTVRTVNIGARRPVVEVEPGRGGPPGAHGPGGAGGPGGLGGIKYYYARGRPRHEAPSECNPTDQRAPSGPPGDNGSQPPEPSTEGRTGAPFTADPLSRIDLAALGAAASLPQLTLLLHFAEERYQNQDFKLCGPAFGWIEALSGDRAAGPQLTDTTWPGVFESKSEEWAALRQRVLTLLGQMHAGLDYYGLPPSYVPLVAADVYRDTAKRMLDTAASVEQAHEAYWRANASKQEKRRSLADAIRIASESATEQEAEAARADVDRALLDREIRELGDTLLVQQQALQIADGRFRKAVSEQAGGCSLVDVLTFVAAVVALAAGVPGATAAIIAEAGKPVADKLSPEDKKNTNIVRFLKVTAANIQDMAKVYAELQKQLAVLKGNQAKIGVEASDFEKQLEPFLKLDAAKKYRDLMRSYADTAKTRNQKAIDYTALEQKRLGHLAEAQRRRAEVDRLNAAVVTETYDPQSVEAEAYMGCLLQQVKQDAVRVLHQERRALEYWALTPIPFAVGTGKVAEIRVAEGKLQQQYVQALEARNRPDQQFKRVIAVTIAAAQYPRAFELFRRTGVLVFEIPLTHPAFQRGWSAITLRDVSLRLPGVGTDDGIVSADLVHSGDARFYDPQRRVRQFSHRPRSTNLAYDWRTGEDVGVVENNLGKEVGTFAALSPFTTWRVRIAHDANRNIRLGAVNEVRLTFGGYYLPFD